MLSNPLGEMGWGRHATPPLPSDWFQKFSEKKTKREAARKFQDALYKKRPLATGKQSAPAARQDSQWSGGSRPSYLEPDGVHCTPDFRVAEELEDDECAARLSSLLEPADVEEQLVDPDEV